MRKFYLPLYMGFRSLTSRRFEWIAVIALLFVSTISNASHMAGGELTYRWLSGTTYEFTAIFYRDCAGVAAPTSLTLNYTSVNCNINKDATLNEVPGTGQEITYPCPSAKTTCEGGTNPGFQEWKYMDTVDIKSHCTDWVFSFTSCCRNAAITTIQNAGSDNMYVEAKLNNTVSSGGIYPSSPTFSNVPISIVCAGQPFTYNQGALDPNGDSLAYSFICPRTDPTTCVTYNAPYTATNPIASSPTATVNAITGSINMNPTTIQVGVATVLVNKYRNGVLIGSVLRDIEILIVACSDNLPTATGINGTNVFGDTVCAGTHICFNILSNDLDVGDIVTMTDSIGSDMAGATFAIAGSPHPTGTFCWTPTLANARTQAHTFTVTVKDNHCPENGVQSYAYSVWVPPIAVNITTANIACSGSTGTATAVGSGGVSPYTYLWSPTSQTTATAIGLSAGITYTAFATDADGCTNTGTIVLTSAPPIIASISDSTEVSCHGGNNGSATITASGGAGGFTYHWSNGETSNPAINLAAGSYIDTVKDASGCAQLVSVTITQPVLLTASITTHQNASCKGEANGTLTVTPAGGTSPYLYSWSPVAGTDSTITNLPAGIDSVTITDSHGCSITKIDSITQPGTLVPLITSIIVNGGNNISCYGLTNGSVSVSVSGGTSPYMYLWSPGGYTTDTVSGLGAGTISVQVTDDNGCTADTSVTLTQPDSLSVTFPDFDVSSYFGGLNISCNGASDGYINPVINGGTPGYQYLWSPGGQTIEDIAGLTAGTYTLTVTDTNGCMASDTITLLQPGPLSSYVSSSTNVGCNGEASGSINDSTTGGTAPYTYAWSTGDTTQNISGLVAGTYSVIITDLNGCTATITDSISQPATLYPLITAATVTGGLNIACSGDSSGSAWATVTGGTPPFMYFWSNGATTDTVYGLPAGPISVHVVDVNGCSKDAFYTISQPEPLSALYVLSSFLGGTNVSCNGASDGFIQLSPDNSGTPGYTYTWSPNVSTDSIATGLSAGLYTVIIADTNGCKDSLSFLLTAPDTLKEFISAQVQNGGWNISCNGASDGYISVDSVQGGTGPFSYSWSPNVSNTSSASGLPQGTYIITVTDTNGCSVTDSITLNQPEPLFDTLSAKVFIGGKNISCYGYSDGNITDSVSGGTPPYVFLWNTGDTTQGLSQDSAGTYVVNITDANGCSIIDSITLIQPDSISPNPLITQYGIYNILCHGGNGCINLNPTGGTAGYTYYWNPTEDSTQNFCDTAGTYNVLITDTNGCVSLSYYTLTQPDSLVSVSLSSNYGESNISCNGSSDGTITVTVTGGVRPYQYSWSGNVSTDSVATGLGAGSYTVTVTDSNGCVISASTTLIAPPPLTDTLEASVYAGGYNVTCVGNDGSITMIVNGGTRPYSYSWSPSVSTDSTASGLIAGTYIITATDSNGCSVVDSITLTQSTTFVLTDSVSSYNGSGVSCSGDTNGYIHVMVSGGVPPYIFHWNTGDTTQNLDNIGAGTYTDTIIDQNGCRTFITEAITEPNPLSSPAVASNYNGSGVKCNGDTTSGFINLTVYGGTPNYTYVWSNSATTQNLDSIGAGIYSVTVTDMNGCTATTSDTLTAPQPVNLSAIDSSYNGSGVKCHTDTNGYIHVLPSGGTANYHYQWSPNVTDTDSVAMNLGAGTYTYTVTDANGCSATGSDTITAPPVFNLTAIDSSYNGSGVKCHTDTNGYIHVIPSGGTANYHYQWSPNVTDMDSVAMNLGAGTYTYTVTDANGCSATGSDTITAPPVFNLTAIDSSYNGSGVKCHTDTNGYIHVIPSGGTANYHYQWSPNVTDTTSVAMNLGAGTYTYMVTDANGCSATGSDTITAPPVFNITAIDSSYHGSGVKCNSDTNGYIHVIPSGGTSNYTYQWSPNVTDMDSIAQNLGAGTYSYTVTDANGCTATGSETLTAPQPVSLSTIDSSYNGRGVKCNGSTDGYIHVIPSGGTSNYTYQWSPNVTDTDSIAQNLGAGTYSYTVTDANGCISMGSDSITAPAPFNVLSDTSNYGNYGTRCNGDSSGYINITVSGGTPVYTYSWSNGATTQNIDSIMAGTYTVVITDGNGCTGTATAVITAPSPIVANAGSNAQICGSSTQLSGAPPGNGYTGIWSVFSGSGTFANVNDPNTTVTGLSDSVPNILQWTVTDGYCSANDTVRIDAFEVVAAAGGANDSICPQKVSSAMLNASTVLAGSGLWVSVGTANVTSPMDTSTGVTNLSTGANNFVWIVTNGPCSASDTVVIYLKTFDQDDCSDSLWMPTGFSPNGDGSHDQFIIQGVEDTKYSLNTFKVFNRWGNEVYSVNNYNNQDIVWAGQNKQGDPLPAGTYFAILTITNSTVELHGYVDLRR